MWTPGLGSLLPWNTHTPLWGQKALRISFCPLKEGESQGSMNYFLECSKIQLLSGWVIFLSGKGCGQSVTSCDCKGVGI